MRTFFNAFVVLCFFSCGVPNYLKERFTCYDGKDTGIDTLINTMDYFKEIRISEKSLPGKIYSSDDTIHGKETGSNNFMFYKDGMCVSGLDNDRDSISCLFRELVKTPDKKHFFYVGSTNIYWGVYKIHGDTIKVQMINHNPLLMAFEEEYKIIDRNTLKPLTFRELDIDTENRKKQEQNPLIALDSTVNLPAIFIPVKEKPGSDCWLKNKKWFWCDKSKYKEWKKGLKTKQ